MTPPSPRSSAAHLRAHRAEGPRCTRSGPSPLWGSRPASYRRAMRIVVGVNESAHAERALHWAAAEARIRDAELHAVLGAGMPLAAYPVGWPSSAIDSEVILEDHRKVLDVMVDRVVGEGAGHRLVTVGSAAEVLLDEAKDADLLVVGTRELHGVFRWLGSVSDQVARHAECPVVVVPETATVGPSGAPIVVGVDGSANSAAAIRWALDEAQVRNVALRAIAVWGFLDQPHDAGEHFDPRYGEGSARDFLSRMVEEALGPD